MIDKTREDFEAWVTKQGHAAGYGGDGVYDVWVVSRWWESWQAATQQSATRIAALEAEVLALRKDAELGSQMRAAIGNEALERFIKKHGAPVPLQLRIEKLGEIIALAFEALKQSHNHMMFAEACGAVTVFDSRSVRDCIDAIETACAAIEAERGEG